MYMQNGTANALLPNPIHQTLGAVTALNMDQHKKDAQKSLTANITLNLSSGQCIEITFLSQMSISATLSRTHTMYTVEAFEKVRQGSCQ